MSISNTANKFRAKYENEMKKKGSSQIISTESLLVVRPDLNSIEFGSLIFYIRPPSLPLAHKPMGSKQETPMKDESWL